jgi:TolB-like protein/Tfp pilus assembly protein PilF
MPDSPNKLSQFWQELKRRKVVRVITVYAAAAFVILELTDIVAPSLGLPDWTLNLVIILLVVGFIIAVIVSWIYDVAPDGGLVKTDTAEPVKDEKKPVSSNTWKIASYISFVVIITLLILNVISRDGPMGENNSADKSIAVLPFKSLSEDQEKQYLADGVMEAILLHLFKIEDLRVIQSASVEKYRDRTHTLSEIASDLNVNYILDGSFQKYEDQAKLIIRLSNGEEEEDNIWAKEYNRDWSDIFSVQSEVAQKVAFALQSVISPEVKERIEALPTENMEAYDYYLKGNESYWASWHNYDINKLTESIEYYQRAINLDENFSFAHTGIGRSYWFFAFLTKSRSSAVEYYRKSKQYLKKAISLDPDNGWAYAELAVVLHNWNWDSKAAKENLDSAIELMPNNANAYIHYFWLETYLGDCSKMQERLEDLEVFYPGAGNPHTYNNLAILQCQNKYSEMVSIANEYYKKLDENLTPTLSMILFNAFLHEKEFEKAKLVLEYVKDSVQNNSNYLVYKALLHAKEGDRKSTMQVLDSLNSLSEVEFVPNTWYAAIYASLDEKESMYQSLNSALSIWESGLHEINWYSVFNTYKEEPRFQEIVRKMWIPNDDH